VRQSRDGGLPDQKPRPYREFGAWLRARRLARRWTQEELAARLSYDVTYVRKIEWGTRKATEGFLARLAEAFELPVESLPDPETGPVDAPTLPVPATSFLGRQREVEELTGLLAGTRNRLVTLLGAPGIGKTRLAIELARRLDDHFEHGARFVPLLELKDPAGVAAAACEAVGLRAPSPQGADRLLADHLRQQELLLVLDNFEHVLGAAPLVATLLAEDRAVRLLVTSREPLRVAGETQFPVPPLASGQAGDGAVGLFVERARTVRPGFSTDDPRDVDAVARICERLDGVPLAIELAAGATRLMTPAELLGELSRTLDLPSEGPLDAPAHQRTLRATIDWSYRLLDGDERTLFARIGVFAGGFTLDSGVAVCGDGFSRAAVLAGLASLVSKSLLMTRSGARGGSRAAPLESIREYALERLDERDEAAELRRRHAAHFAAMAEASEAGLTGPDQAGWLDALGDEHANFLAALQWAVACEPATALRLAGGLWRFWLLRGHFTEGRHWLRQALTAGLPDDPARARAAVGAGVLARSQGDYDEADRLFEEAAALARAHRDDQHLALARQNSGIVAENRGRYDDAASLFQESLALSRAAGSQRGVGHALNGLGHVALDRGDLASATGFFEQALAAFRNLEDQWSIALVCTNLGWVAQTSGDTAQARTWYSRSLAVHRSLGHQRGIANTLCNIGRVAATDGEASAARAFLEEALLMFRRLGERRGVAECLEELAALAVREGLLARAARLYSAAAALRDAIGIPPLPTQLEVHGQSLAVVQAGLDRHAFEEAWTDGRGMSTDEAITVALAGRQPDLP
jgi:predicted ATPase/Tfp pilus assembly protein PilF